MPILPHQKLEIKSVEFKPLPKKQCEAEGCDEYFEPDFPKMRRCYTCRLLKRPYKNDDLPF